MRTVYDSDVFNSNPKAKESITTKIRYVVENKAPGLTIINNKIPTILATMRATFKETITRDVCTALANGELKMYIVDQKYSLPSSIPFFKYAKGGKTYVGIDVTNYTTVTKNAETGENIYKIDVKKLYALTVTAYVYLRAIDARTTLPPRVTQSLARIWSEMVCKILANEIGLATNPDRYDAFMYFCAKFFCKYYLQTPDGVADNISLSILKTLTKRAINPLPGQDDRNPTIIHIESSVADRGIDMYESLEVFLMTMFNYEITGIRPGRLSDRGRSLDYKFFVTKWMKTYDYTSLYALGALPYFLLVIISSFNNAYMCNDKILESIVAKSHARDTAAMLNDLYAMC